MGHRLETGCTCDVKLPHTVDQVQAYSRRAMPTYRYPGDQANELWARKEAKRVNELSAAVEGAYSEAAQLKQRIGDIEEKIKEAREKGNLSVHECAISRRFSETWEPKPPEPPNKDKALAKELQRKLEKANVEAIQHRNEIHKLKQDLQLAKELVCREIGVNENVSLKELLNYKTVDGWKGRIQVIRNLRAKVAELESSLFETKQMLRHGSEGGGSAHSYETMAEYAVPEKQRLAINKLYSDKTEQIRALTQQIATAEAKYKELQAVYKATASRNLTLVRALKDQTEKAKHYEAKAKKDQMLTTVLSQHHGIIKELLDEHRKIAHLAAARGVEVEQLLSSPKCQGKDAARVSEQVESEKYKTLWKTSESNAQNLEGLVFELQGRLDVVSMQLMEAERHCCNHRCELEALQRQMEELTESGKLSSKTKITKDKNYKYMISEEYLQAIREENRLLRELLQNSVFTKADDFRTYKAILEAARAEYLSSVQKISEIVNPPQPDTSENDIAKE